MNILFVYSNYKIAIILAMFYNLKFGHTRTFSSLNYKMANFIYKIYTERNTNTDSLLS